MKVNVNWLVNHWIHNNMDVVFVSWPDVDSKQKVICYLNDDYFNNNKAKILNSVINFFVLKPNDNLVEVFLYD